LGLAKASARLSQEAALDDSILERMKRDNRQPPSVSEHRNRIRDESLQRLELVVDRNSQRLKRTRRRVNAPTARNVEAPHYYVSNLLCCRYWLAIALLNYSASDLPRAALLSVFKYQICKLLLAKLIHQIGRCRAGGLIHTHVEWRVAGKAEPALAALKLQRRDSQIGQNATRLVDSRLLKNRRYVPEVRMN